MEGPTTGLVFGQSAAALGLWPVQGLGRFAFGPSPDTFAGVVILDEYVKGLIRGLGVFVVVAVKGVL